jgi:hypothetical protein
MEWEAWDSIEFLPGTLDASTKVNAMGKILGHAGHQVGNVCELMGKADCE